MVQSRSINKQRVRALPATSIQSHARQSVDNQPFIRVFFLLSLLRFFLPFYLANKKEERNEVKRKQVLQFNSIYIELNSLVYVKFCFKNYARIAKKNIYHFYKKYKALSSYLNG